MDEVGAVATTVAYGTPTYRFEGGWSDYERYTQEANARLFDVFQGLYAKVLGFLSDYFSREVILLDPLAYPGFHILSFKHSPYYDPGPPHCDFPYLRIPWKNRPLIDAAYNHSFVLTIKLPVNGSGLQVCDTIGPCSGIAHFDKSANVATEDFNWNQADAEYISYREGELILFNGNHYHRIAPTVGLADECRITLQGHVISNRNQLIAYW